MTENNDNVYYIDVYREEKSQPKPKETDAGRRLTIHTEGGIAASIRDEVAASGEDVPTVFKEVLALGIAHRQMMRDGWRGPIYKRARAAQNMAERLLARLGLGREDEVVRLTPTRPETPEQPEGPTNPPPAE